ncbi:LamG domain-containing protein [Flagellimonas sp. CMM7]|uniref:LamG domain-containing protein n=1 Tax=Flagellimonas sp. CMM7 TaxID=2654676 RepID=UPI0013D826E5|nr:LamG domain-containing protein [Flagellimonas sp. CMM7]UII79884.1 LamG domain-containing protein [Flagellimonas sp. CMM7]
MNYRNISLVISLAFLLFGIEVSGQDNFYAYHTKVQHSPSDYVGKYADLIVVLGENKLEFTRQTGYLPKWTTSSHSFLVDDFFPEKDIDTNFEYSYVRLLEESNEQIIVHWRYVKDIEIFKRANKNLDSKFEQGLTHVVHEIFTIYPNGKVERQVKDATGSSYNSWSSKEYADRQTFTLSNSGIDYSPVEWGYKGWVKPERGPQNKVISTSGLKDPVLHWKFDMDILDAEDVDGIADWEMEYYKDSALETITEEIDTILGGSYIVKKGVSGRALAFDGYYTGVEHIEKFELPDNFTVEGWIALDVYPYNEAPLIHNAINFGEQGFYLGVDAYGFPFLRVNGKTIKSDSKLPLYLWKHLSASVEENNAIFYLDGEKVGSTVFKGSLKNSKRLSIGLNTDKARGTDYVREFSQNLPFIYGIQGIIDEVKVYNAALSEKQIAKHYNRFVPTDRTSPVEKAVLPGEVGVAENFGAYYKTLDYHELWDKMWRLTDKTDIVVKFEDSPVSVVYWHGSNFAANWVLDNNRWMADQSSEIFTKHGCSEHMSDKQNRHSYSRIIENNPARVVVHWRYPCVDIGYICTNKANYTDEYHTIYPDGTAIRKTVFNNKLIEAPGFQDVQFFTNPGEDALDVVNINAVTVANTKGETVEYVWEKPNVMPEGELEDASIQWMNSKSDWKIYKIYDEEGIFTWGEDEQSKYTDDPFAGPWNHWPISLLPSDGRFAIDSDRVTHFALGTGGPGPEASIFYGFTDKTIHTLIDPAKYFQNAPKISEIDNGKSKGFMKAEKAYLISEVTQGDININIDASKESPIHNPAFVFDNIKLDIDQARANGKKLEMGKEVRVGHEYNAQGKPKTIVWLQFNTDKQLSIEIK